MSSIPEYISRIGRLIEDEKRRNDWIDLVGTAHLASQPGGPLDGWVFHGTDGASAELIEIEGLRSTHTITAKEPGQWRFDLLGCHFGTPAVAAFFAEDLIESLEDPNIDLVLFAVRMDELASLGQLVPDGAMVDVPLYTRLRRSEQEVDALLQPGKMTWRECYDLLETVIVLADVPAERLVSIRSHEDLKRLIGKQRLGFKP